VLFLALEGLYRAQAALRADPAAPARPAVDSTLHPYAREAWWGQFQGADGQGARDNHFDLYRGHLARPASSRYVNIDSAGRRLTPQAPPSGQGMARQIFMLGGSTMWGYAVRDSFTIPVHLARELHQRGVTDVEVVNLAQVGYNSTQDAITLLLELANGRVPAAAVALDGFNDIATGLEYGGAGHGYSETALGRLIQRARRPTFEELTDLGQASALVMGIRRKLGLDRPAAAAPHRAPAVVCAEVARYYQSIARSTTAIGQATRFPVLHLLQPFYSAGHKPPSPWELTLRPDPADAPCATAIEEAMARDPGAVHFMSLTGMFDAESTTIFVDQYSHVTEAANRLIAARIADALMPLVGR